MTITAFKKIKLKKEACLLQLYEKEKKRKTMTDTYHWSNAQGSTVEKEAAERRKLGTGVGRGSLTDGTARG